MTSETKGKELEVSCWQVSLIIKNKKLLKQKTYVKDCPCPHKENVLQDKWKNPILTKVSIKHMIFVSYRIKWFSFLMQN